MTDTEQAGIVEYVHDQFVEALLQEVEVCVHLMPQAHSGRYVPGGTYRETLAELEIADKRVAVELSSLEDVPFIPRSITARHDGCSNGQDFEMTLQFDLHHVTAPFGDHSEGLAIYDVTEA